MRDLGDSDFRMARAIARQRKRDISRLTLVEVVSASYLGLVLAARAFRGGAWGPYARRACHRQITDESRRQSSLRGGGRRWAGPRPTSSVLSESAWVADRCRSPLDDVDDRDEATLYLALMTGPERETVRLWMAGESPPEIAARLGIARETACRRVKAALDRCRAASGSPAAG